MKLIILFITLMFAVFSMGTCNRTVNKTTVTKDDLKELDEVVHASFGPTIGDYRQPKSSNRTSDYKKNVALIIEYRKKYETVKDTFGINVVIALLEHMNDGKEAVITNDTVLGRKACEALNRSLSYYSMYEGSTRVGKEIFLNNFSRRYRIDFENYTEFYNSEISEELGCRPWDHLKPYLEKGKTKEENLSETLPSDLDELKKFNSEYLTTFEELKSNIKKSDFLRSSKSYFVSVKIPDSTTYQEILELYNQEEQLTALQNKMLFSYLKRFNKKYITKGHCSNSNIDAYEKCVRKILRDIEVEDPIIASQFIIANPSALRLKFYDDSGPSTIYLSDPNVEINRIKKVSF